MSVERTGQYCTYRLVLLLRDSIRTNASFHIPVLLLQTILWPSLNRLHTCIHITYIRGTAGITGAEGVYEPRRVLLEELLS